MRKCSGPIRLQVFKIWFPKNYWSYKVDFLHAVTYLLKLQIDDMILGERGQGCPGMPKRLLKFNWGPFICVLLLLRSLFYASLTL